MSAEMEKSRHSAGVSVGCDNCRHLGEEPTGEAWCQLWDVEVADPADSSCETWQKQEPAVCLDCGTGHAGTEDCPPVHVYTVARAGHRYTVEAADAYGAIQIVKARWPAHGEPEAWRRDRAHDYGQPCQCPECV